MITKKQFFAFFILAFAVSCGSGSSDGGSSVADSTPTASSDSNLTLSVTDAATSQSLPPPGKAVISASKALVTTGSCLCVSKNSSGTKTTKTGSFDGSGNCVLASIPNSQETICYILNSSGAVTSTIQVADTNAVGGLRDGFKTASSGTATVTYNSTTGSSSATCSVCSAPASGGGSAIDISGLWLMNCNGIKFIQTDAADSSQACKNDFVNQYVYLHRVAASDANGVTRYGYGAWPSPGDFFICGSTEGLQSLPSGWTMSTTGQTSDFSWGAPFESFSASSTSAQIATMIQNVGGTHGIQTFSAFSDANCTGGFNTNQCVAMFYWVRVAPYIGSAPGDVCWPRINMTWLINGVSFSPDTAVGGLTQPLNRHEFMPTYSIGNQTYMKSFRADTEKAYDSGSNTLFDCLSQKELLISLTTPSGTPETGTLVTAKFTSNKKVQSVSGDADQTTICRKQVGSNSSFSNNGTYMDMSLIKQ